MTRAGRRPPHLAAHHLAFRARTAGPVRSQNLIAVASNLHAAIAAGAGAAIAIERTDAPGFGLDGIERIEAGDPGVEPCAGIVVEGRKRSAACCIPFTVDFAGLASDPLEFGLQQAGNILQCRLISFRCLRSRLARGREALQKLLDAGAERRS